MTKEEFTGLAIEKQGAIANYMQALSLLRRQRIRLLMFAFVAVAPLLGAKLFDHGETGAFHGPDFMLGAIQFLLTPSVSIALTLLMLALTVALSLHDFQRFFITRKEMIRFGVLPKDIHGITDDDVFYLFVLPQLERQGVQIKRD